MQGKKACGSSFSKEVLSKCNARPEPLQNDASSKSCVGRAETGSCGKWRVASNLHFMAEGERATEHSREVPPIADRDGGSSWSGSVCARRIISWPHCTARRPPCRASRSSTIKLHHGLAKPNASERIRHWSVNRKHCELESVAGLDFGAKHHAIGHVEALNGSRAGIVAPARHLAIDPDFRIIVDQDVEHRHGRLTEVEIADPRWHGQQPAEPHEGGMATTAAHTRSLPSIRSHWESSKSVGMARGSI